MQRILVDRQSRFCLCLHKFSIQIKTATDAAFAHSRLTNCGSLVSLLETAPPSVVWSIREGFFVLIQTNLEFPSFCVACHNSIFVKRDDFTFRIVNFPHMDSNIPANPAYGVYISQLVRYARICTSKVDFINRLRGLSLRLRQQGFETNLLQKSFNKFFSRHGLIVEKYGAPQREMRLAIQAWIAPSYPNITYFLHRFVVYHGPCARAILFCARALFINLIDVCI